MSKEFEFYKKSADYVKSRMPFAPEYAIILGTGLGGFTDMMTDKYIIDYKDIPNFLTTSNESHAGKLVFGIIRGVKIVCMSGRFHFYEGYGYEQLTIPIRLFKLLDVKATILTNAAGAVNTSYRVGDIMLICDHIKMTGASPLCGKNVPEFGERFFDTTRMYTPELRTLAKKYSEGSGLTLREGVYMFFTGPQFETPAEIRAARLLGADAVGMSTVTEALTAAHCHMPILAFSVMTNMAAGILNQPLSDEEVDIAAAKIKDRFGNYIATIIEHMGEVEL